MVRILGFDGIRAIAILLVILAHTHAFIALAHRDLLPWTFIPLVSGETGVMLFFIMSGFLITFLLIQEHERAGRIDLWGFYIRRSLRILPIYFLSLLFVYLVRQALATDITDKAFAFSALFIFNFIPTSDYSTTLGHLWSLAVEEHFYLLWPFAFLALMAGSRIRRVLLVAGAVVATHLLLVLLENLTDLGQSYTIRYWTIIAGGHIGLGCLMALLVTSGWQRTVSALSSRTAVVLGFALFLGSVLLGAAGEHLRPVGLALVVTWVFLNQDSVVVKFLELSPIAYVGRISYGLYIYQGILLGTGPHRPPGLEWPPTMFAGLMALVIVAPLSFHLIERPILRLKPSRRHVRSGFSPSDSRGASAGRASGLTAGGAGPAGG